MKTTNQMYLNLQPAWFRCYA